jgi:hypothetical protein
MMPITTADPPNGQVLLAEFSTFRAAEWGLSAETDGNQLKKRVLQDKMPGLHRKSHTAAKQTIVLQCKTRLSPL